MHSFEKLYRRFIYKSAIYPELGMCLRILYFNSNLPNQRKHPINFDMGKKYGLHQVFNTGSLQTVASFLSE